MSSAPRKSMHPAVVVALGVLLFVGVFALVQWLLHPLSVTRDASADTGTSPAAPLLPAFGSGGATPAVAEAAGMPDGPSPAAGVDSDGRSCRIALTGVSSVSRACATGGIAGAKKEMKRLVFAAKANGVMFACDSCHEGSSTENDLIGEARDKFVDLVAAAGPAPPVAPPAATDDDGTPSPP